MFKNKPRKNRFGAPSASRLRLENLEERQLLTAVGLLDAPYGPEPAPVVCTAAPEVDNSPAVDLSDVVLVTTGETTTWTVTTNADSGVGSLRSAISSASEGDTIKFDLPVDQRVISLNSTLTISKSLTIDASNLPNEDGTPGVTIDAQNKNCVISVSSSSTVSSKVVLNGLKITGGKTSSNGGGICIGERSWLETINTTISNNTATGNGGGVYIDNMAVFMSTNTTISNNTADSGGGVYKYRYGGLEFTNTTISNNTATGDGGGVYGYGRFTNTTISNNTATGNGGGVYELGSSNFTNTTISNNTANSGGGVYGGGDFTNTTITNNTATGNGGGVYVRSDSDFTNTTITNNTATGNGGGVYFCERGYSDFTNTTITNNTANSGGGLCAYDFYTVRNSIIVGNKASTYDADIQDEEEFGEADNSLSSFEFTCGDNNIKFTGDASKLFKDPNPTEEGKQPDYSLNALVDGVKNPAIDAGKNSYVKKIPTDLAGNARIYGDYVDLGAYEYVPTVIPLTQVMIDGTAEVGVELTANVEPNGAAATYQWYRGDDPIKNANDSTYVVSVFDVGKTLKVVASGTGNYSGTVSSAATQPVPQPAKDVPIVIKPTEENFAQALQVAEDGGTIKFAESDETQTITIDSTINVSKSLTIDGTGAKIVFDAAPTQDSPLSTTGDPLDGEGQRRLFEVESGKTLILTNVTLQNGSADYGGAIKNAGTLTLNGVMLTNNKATKNGGAVFNDFGATLTVSGGSITDNEAAKNGGAFANYGTMTIIGSDLTTIRGNTASRFGGAYFGCGTLIVSGNAKFDQNKVTADGSKGGAIYNDVNGTAGTVSIIGTVEFSKNTAKERGGAIMSYSNNAGKTTLTVKGETTFDGNEALQYGGAIDVGQYCNALLGGELTFTDNKATSTNLNEGFGGAIFSVETLTFDADGTYTFTGNTATKSGGAIDACAGTLNLAGDKFTFGSNVANEVYGDDKTGFGGAIATAAVTTVTNGTTFEWKADNKAARGNCVAIDLGISPGLTSASFGLEPGDDYSTFTVIRPNAVKTSSVMVPATFASNAVVATITTSGVSTTFGSEGATPEQLGLGAGTHEALIQYTNVDRETSAVYSLVLTVDSAASLDVCETSIANGRGVKFDFNLTNADGRAVSVWEIAWGDGTTTRLEKLSTSWLAAHYYAQDGTFDVSLTIEYLDGTGETFEAFSTQRIGVSPVATTGKSDALACVFAEPEDLFDEFGDLDDLIGPMSLR